MDATTIGAVLACVGVLGTAVVAFIGKRGENATTRFNSVTDQVQEENAKLSERLATREARIETLEEQRRQDLEAITRLRIKIIHLGGDPDQ
ncbi:hypothetical protein ACFV3E_24460 [Streptomyces sp. NPDC059718]